MAVTTAGAAAGRGRAGAGNPMALGARRAFANLALSVREALTQVDPSEVRAVTVGLAGLGMLHDPAVRAAFQEALRGCGLTVAPARWATRRRPSRRVRPCRRGPS
nr:hypothetical protein GCM10020093_071160 [Planobispora longispora]